MSSPLSRFGVQIKYPVVNLSPTDKGDLGEATTALVAAFFRDTLGFNNAYATLLCVGPDCCEIGMDVDLASTDFDAGEVRFCLDCLTRLLNKTANAHLMGTDSGGDDYVNINLKERVNIVNEILMIACPARQIGSHQNITTITSTLLPHSSSRV